MTSWDEGGAVAQRVVSLPQAQVCLNGVSLGVMGFLSPLATLVSSYVYVCERVHPWARLYDGLLPCFPALLYFLSLLIVAVDFNSVLLVYYWPMYSCFGFLLSAECDVLQDLLETWTFYLIVFWCVFEVRCLCCFSSLRTYFINYKTKTNPILWNDIPQNSTICTNAFEKPNHFKVITEMGCKQDIKLFRLNFLLSVWIDFIILIFSWVEACMTKQNKQTKKQDKTVIANRL